MELGTSGKVDANCAVNERVFYMDNKYTIEVLRKELDNLKEEKLGLELLKEADNEFTDEYLNRQIKGIDKKIIEIEFHIDFVS